MASNNLVVLMGNLGNDPAEDIQTLPSGDRKLEVRICHNERRKNKATGEYEDKPNWFAVTFWNQKAENFAKLLGKGCRVIVQGKLKVDTWEKEGEKRSKVYIEGDDFTPITYRDKGDAPPASSGSSKKPAAAAPAKDDFSDDFALDDDELPPF